MRSTDELNVSRAGDLDRGESSAELQPQRKAMSPTVVLILALILLVGAAVRVTGWTGGGLFFDDAWVALPARVPFGTATHMWLSAPGFTLVQREWDLLWPGNMHWVVALPLITGILAPAAAFWLGRILRFPDWIALTMAAFIAVEPCAIQYSVAVKSFEFEVIACVGLLALGELARRNRTTRSLVTLMIASIGAVFVDSALSIVVIGVWLALALVAVLDERNRTVTLFNGAVTGLVLLPVMFGVEQGIPPYDASTFRYLGTLVGPPYTAENLFTVFVKSGGGLAHGMFGTPIPYVLLPRIPDTVLGAFVVAVTVCEIALLVVLGLPAVMACVRRRSGDPALRVLPSLFVVLVAIFAFLIGKVPLGDGRTDLLIVPAITVLLASGLQRLAAFIRRRISGGALTRLGVTAAAVAGVGACLLAWDLRSWYPTQDLTGLDRQIVRQMHPNDVFVVTFRNSYTWAYDQLTPFRVHFSATSDQSLGIGYWVTFDSSHVLEQESPATAGMIPGLANLPPDHHRLWLIETTILNQTPSTLHPKGRSALLPYDTGAAGVLSQAGWHATSVTLRATGVLAILFVRG
jgi:hypothetical protein